MKRRKMWKQFAAVLAAGSVLLTACGSQATTGSTEGGAQTQQADAGEENKSSDEKTVLTIAMKQESNIIDFDTNYLTKRLEEEFNVDLQQVVLPADDKEFMQKLSLMVSSGEKLPDIFCTGSVIKVDDASLYGQNGAFIPLNKYLEDEAMSPVMHQNIPAEDLEYMLSSVTSADGNIYGVPIYGAEIGNECAYRAWINTTWLDALGLKMPTTTEEFYNTLKAFKEQDPNGNGIQDEIPMMGSSNGWNQNPIPFLMNAFVYTDPGKNYVYVEDRKIVPAFTKEEWKEGLIYINSLVSEGLISPLSFTQDVTQFKTILENEDAQLMGCIAAASVSVYAPDSKRVTDMDVLPPLTGPEGKCFAQYGPTVPAPQYFITKDCENPDLAFQIADYMFDKEMSMVQRFGEPGVDWDTNVGDLKSPYEESMGVKTGFREIENIWGVPQNSHWEGANPTYRGGLDPMSAQGKGIDMETATGMSIMTPKAVPYYLDKHPEELITRYAFTEEELNDLATLRTDVDTYVKESMTRFAVGEMPITEWDNYIATLNSMGLDRYLEILQSGYDRACGK